MLGSTHYGSIPLPKAWLHRVRSAVIHSISLVHYSLTATRSWAANSLNDRIRLKQKNGRLRQELALLQKEMRIKDARLAALYSASVRGRIATGGGAGQAVLRLRLSDAGPYRYLGGSSKRGFVPSSRRMPI
jgi:hypothetical protein